MQSIADLEFQPSDVIRAESDRLLREHIRYAAENSPFYRKRFADAGISPDDINCAADLAKLPFTTKADLEQAGRDLLCVPESEIVDLCLTSGTTGKPVTLLQTQADLDRLAYNEEISFRSAGFTEDDRVVVVCAMGRCFMAGLAYFLGLTRLGAMAIRAGSSSIGMVMETIRTQKPTALVGVPSLLLAVAGRLSAEGIDVPEIGVRRIVCIGEPVRAKDLGPSALGEKLAAAWGAKVYGTYASTEMATAFCDCEAEAGGHLHPDLLALELVDDDGNAVAPGAPGEVVATPLQVTGMPLLRLRTGDIATMYVETCSCGRTSPRLGPIIGRKSQMLKFRGTTVYPPAIFSVLQEIPEVRGYYLEVHDDFELSDHIRVVAGVENGSITADLITERIAAAIRVKPEVVVTSPAEVQSKVIQEGKRKPVTFFDYRRKMK